MEKKWWHQAVVYQIYPRSFYDSNGDGIGDLKGIIDKLDYLKILGINVIWLSPVNTSPMDDNGYDISDYENIASEFGTLDDMECLIQEAAKRDIKIVMDLVINHTSDEHPWFIASKSSRCHPKRHWYIWRKGKDEITPPNNWASWFTRSAWEYDPDSKEYYLHLFSKKQPDLNWANPEVRQALYDLMGFWIAKGIGGFRMDVINLIGKPSDYPDGALTDLGVVGMDHFCNHSLTHEYLREMHQKVLANHDLLTVGETPLVTPYEAKLYTHPMRKELGMIFQFEHMDVDKDNAFSEKKPLDLVGLKRIMTRWQEEIYPDGWNSLYWNNHDQARIVSRFGNDQEYRVESGKMLATTLHFMLGTPYIYQGEEIGMTNTYFKSIEEYNDLMDHHKYDVMTKDMGLSHSEAMDRIQPFSRDNARTPFHWDTSLNAGFSTGTPWLPVNDNHLTINAKMALEDNRSIFYHYQKLIKLRRNSEYSNTIVYGKHTLLLDDDPHIYAYKRSYKNQTILVISNFSEHHQNISLNEQVITPIIHNYDTAPQDLQKAILRPYESIAYLVY